MADFVPLANRARRLLRERGGRLPEAELLAGLFGASQPSDRWRSLLAGVLAPLADIRPTGDGDWELVVPPAQAGVPARMLAEQVPSSANCANRAFVALASVATSADPWRARLLALAAARQEAGEQVGTFAATFNPRCRVPGYLVTATGVSWAEIEESPRFSELVDDLLEFLADLPLVGLDIETQTETIGRELSLLDRPGLRNRRIDLAHLATQAGLATSKPSLVRLAEAAGLSHPRPYHPVVDARVTARLAARLLVGAAERGLDPLTDSVAPTEHLPALLRRPDPPPAVAGPGVYLLKDAAGCVLYVGKARNLARRLAAYHRKQLALLRRLEGLAARVEGIQTIATASELEALIVEARLLHQHRPPFNVQRQRRPAASYLRAELSARQASLTLCNEVCDDGARYLGPFRTATGATETLRLCRQLFPELKGRARAQAELRRPLVEAALRFLDGDRWEVVEQLRAEQRLLAAAGEQQRLQATQLLLNRVIHFELEIVRLPVLRPEERLVVLSPKASSPPWPEPDLYAWSAESGAWCVHVLHGGRLMDCFEADDEDQACARAARCEPPPAAPDEAQADERSIVFRWLCSLGPGHLLLQIDATGQRVESVR